MNIKLYFQKKSNFIDLIKIEQDLKVNDLVNLY